MTSIPRLLVAAAKDFVDDKAPRLAAALSYYTAFSLPPLLVAVIGVAGIVYGVDQVRESILSQVANLVGTDSAATLGEAVANAQQTTGSGIALVLGLATLLIGATGAFGQLQEALNTIWEVEPKKGGGIWRLVRSRLLSFGTILGTGFLLLVSLTVSAAIGALVDVASNVEWMAPYIAVSGRRGLADRDHLLVRSHFQASPGHQDRMAGRVGRCRSDRDPLRRRQVRHRLLPGSQRRRIRLRSGRLDHRHPGLDLLLRPDPFLRCGVHPGLGVKPGTEVIDCVTGRSDRLEQAKSCRREITGSSLGNGGRSPHPRLGSQQRPEVSDQRQVEIDQLTSIAEFSDRLLPNRAVLRQARY